MKAVRLLEYGGQLVFNDVPTPVIARDEILVKIKSTAVNHLDLVKASGTARQILPSTYRGYLASNRLAVTLRDAPGGEQLKLTADAKERIRLACESYCRGDDAGRAGSNY